MKQKLNLEMKSDRQSQKSISSPRHHRFSAVGTGTSPGLASLAFRTYLTESWRAAQLLQVLEIATVLARARVRGLANLLRRGMHGLAVPRLALVIISHGLAMSTGGASEDLSIEASRGKAPQVRTQMNNNE